MTRDTTARDATECLARQVAHAAGSFEHRLLGRAPSSITVASAGGLMTVFVHEPLAPVERRLVRDADGAARVRALHHDLFDDALDALVVEIRRRTGVMLCGAITHLDTATGSILKAFTTGPCVDLFLFGAGLPALGVPVDAHLRGSGTMSHEIPSTAGWSAGVSSAGLRIQEAIEETGNDVETRLEHETRLENETRIDHVERHRSRSCATTPGWIRDP